MIHISEVNTLDTIDTLNLGKLIMNTLVCLHPFYGKPQYWQFLYNESVISMYLPCEFFDWHFIQTDERGNLDDIFSIAEYSTRVLLHD